MIKLSPVKFLLLVVIIFSALAIEIFDWYQIFSDRTSISTKKHIDFQFHKAELRNHRYCEVLYGDRKFMDLEIKVFSTQGINDCPSGLWEKLTAEDIKKSRHAGFALLNGPRFWTMDQIKLSNNPINDADESFMGIQMQQRAVLRMNFLQQFWQDRFYSPRKIERTTQFIYDAGKNIYELISPKGEVYVMQSYSQIIDKELSEDDLPQLAQKLSLPNGWKYRMVAESRDLIIQASGVAYVIQDNLFNTYQLQQ